MKIKMKCQRLFIIAVTVFSLSQQAMAQLPLDTLETIRQVLDIKEKFAPGAVVSISRHGSQIFSVAYGYADLEHAIKNTRETIFEAGSVSKQFTAAALLMLIEEGKINLDDEVRKYIPELPDYGKRLTVKNILTHTSGVKDWGSVAALGGWPRGTKRYTQNISREIIFNQNSLNFNPGFQYSYSNSGYALAAMLVERISKKTLAEFTKERIFLPVGMTHTTWRDDFREIVPGRAIGYRKSGGEYLMNMPFENTHGHAGLLTTTTDLLKWNDYWADGRFGKKMGKMRLEQGVLNNGFTIIYACGAVRVSQLNGYKSIDHSGSTAGYRAWLCYYPEKDLSVAILSNDASGRSVVRLGRELAEVFLGKEKIVPAFTGLSATQLKEKAGLYKSVQGVDLVEFKTNAKRLFTKGGTRLKALNSNSFEAGSRKYIFKENGKNLEISTDNGSRFYKKVAKVTPSVSELKAFLGDYKSEEANAVISVRIENGKLLAYRTPSVFLTLLPSYKNAFTTRSNIVIEFIINPSNKITGFTMNIDRAENILFRKQ